MTTPGLVSVASAPDLVAIGQGPDIEVIKFRGVSTVAPVSITIIQNYAENVAVVLEQVAPAATWIFDNPLHRLVTFDVFIGNESVDTEVYVDTDHITVVLPSPMSGFIVIS